MLKQVFILLIILVAFGCSNRYYSERTTAENRQLFEQKIKTDIIQHAASVSPDSVNWDEVFWAIYMFHQNNHEARACMLSAQKQYEHFNSNSRYNFWLAASGFSWTNELTTLKGIALSEQEPKIRLAASQLFLNDSLFIDSLIGNLDANWRYLFQNNSFVEIPDNSVVKKVLNSEFLKGKKNIVCLMPKNRDYTGLVLLIDDRGEPLKSKGKILMFRYLARSATNFPFYLTNGNSPCGLYSIAGITQSENVFIGPVPTVQTRMPFEVSTGEFFHKDSLNNREWSLELYKNLTGLEHPQFLQSFLAGKMGRTEIIMHGSTINPEFYKTKSFYPLTPSLGCITGFELWNTENGHLNDSDHLQLINNYKNIKGEPGFMLLVNIIDEDRPVTPDDFINFF